MYNQPGLEVSMRSTLLVLMAATCNVCSLAQAAPPQLSASEVQVLLERINKLESRVAELEAKDASTAALRDGAPVQNQAQPSAPPPMGATSQPQGQTGHAAEVQQQVAAEHE